MPTIFEVSAAALTAAAFFSVIGWPLAQRLLPPVIAQGAAPALGWALYCAVALPLYTAAGFTGATIALLSGLCLVSSLAAWRRAPGLPWWAWALAGLLAILPALALMPKYADGGVLLGPPMFDHVKVAMIDGMVRQGLPPANPFFGGPGSRALTYYYLWHFSAAVLAKASGLGGWASDVAMTWFTAWASVTLMMGLAVHASGRRAAAALVALLCIPASLRPVAGWFFGQAAVRAALPPGGDIGAWLNQASWVPQHLASACCVMLAALLIAGLADAPWFAVPALGLVVASGFESSTWVGGVAFAAAAAAVSPVLLFALPSRVRLRFAMRAAGAAVAAVVLATPFLISQAHSVAARGVGFPIALQPYQAFARMGAGADLLAFWVFVLPFNFPALFPAGLAGLWHTLRAGRGGRHLPVLAGFAGACLAVTWLCRSTIDNNDLGWRAPIPAVLLLTVFAAAAWVRWMALPWRWPASAALLLALLGLAQSGEKFGEAVHGQRPADAAGFAQSAPLWAALRRHAAPAARVANNPLMLATMTPWPDDISWALLSDRPSCYAGWAASIAYAGVPREQLLGIDTLFRRVFAGEAQPDDADALASHFDCRIAVVTPADGAWQHDPFAPSPAWRLVEHSPAWRIYRRAATD